jgi:hypothetical protein
MFRVGKRSEVLGNKAKGIAPKALKTEGGLTASRLRRLSNGRIVSSEKSDKASERYWSLTNLVHDKKFDPSRDYSKLAHKDSSGQYLEDTWQEMAPLFVVFSRNRSQPFEKGHRSGKSPKQGTTPTKSAHMAAKKLLDEFDSELPSPKQARRRQK